MAVLKEYKVTITDYERWTGYVKASSKNEAIEAARKYLNDGSLNWRTVKTTAKAEIMKENRNDNN